MQAARARRARATCAAQVAGPGAARAGSRPTTRSAASASCSRTTTIRRSASPTSSSSPTGIARGPRALGRRPRTASSARSTRSSSAPASTSPTCRSRSACAGADGRTLADVWEGSRSAYLGTHGRRLPEPVLPARPEHRPRAQLDGLHDRVADRATCSTRCAPCDARRRADRSRCARGRRTRYNDEIAAAHARARSGTRRLRELVPRRATGATRRSGPTGRGASGARLARFDPATSEHRRPPAPDRVSSSRRGMSARVHHRRGGGIGAAAAAELRARGAAGRRRSTSTAPGTRSSTATCATRRAVDRAVAEAIERLGGLDVLINNAGARHAAERRARRPTRRRSPCSTSTSSAPGG